MEDKKNLYKEYPEAEMTGRLKKAFNWLPEKSGNLLDAGCSYGYGTRFFAQKAEKTYGIELNPLHIEIARSRYPYINFSLCSVENTNFQENFFDAVVMTDVLEHTNDKIKSLNELYRILRPGGVLILSTPHRGLFGFLDPYNYGYFIRKYFFGLYKFLYKIIRLLKEGKFPKEFNPEHLQKHEHYSLKDFEEMLNDSDFKEKYEIKDKFLSGLFIEVFTMIAEVFLNIFFGRKVVKALLKPLTFLSEKDYEIPYGRLSYNIALKIIKKS
jgi:ubiquinone/menaquinone biosynthesis C-methylase UbiE